MVRVCVVGGGTAGAEAAREASRGGAEVTLLERLEEPEPPWQVLPDLVGPARGVRPPVLPRRLGESAIATVTGTEVESVDQGLVCAAGAQIRFDFAIIATGSGFEPAPFPGQRKEGVVVLDGADRYAELGRRRCRISRAVVRGEGSRALEVSDRLSAGGVEIRLLVTHWRHGAPSPEVASVLSDAASDQGVSLSQGEFTKAVGSDALEAVVVSGTVVPCDCLAIVPRRVPRVPPLPVEIGPKGGFVVDRSLRTSSTSTYAVGGCAELKTGLPPSATLDGEAAISGRIAAANSTGKAMAIGSFRIGEVVAFGLRWSRAGAGPGLARAAGLEVEVVSRRWGPRNACTLVFESRSGRVIGVETVEEADSPYAAIPSVLSQAASLKTLAYGCLGSSTDISLISDTARLGLRLWSRC